MIGLTIVLVPFLTFVAPQGFINPNIVNKNVERSIDLTTQLVKITTTITLENTGKNATRNYLVVLEPASLSNLSYFWARDSTYEALKIVPLKVEGHEDKEIVGIQLKQLVGSGRTLLLILEYIFSNCLVPYPSSITQMERQFVRYFGNHYFYTPYPTIKQSTTVTTYSKIPESYTKLKPVSQSDYTITYGPYNSIPSFTLNQMDIHFESNALFLSVKRLERLIEVSHWGNIAVEEDIRIVHSGAKLTGPFSRYDYQRDGGTNKHSIAAYKTILPATAHSIYYRDNNGNISTSGVKPRKDWIELELRPRYPLFGGWRTAYIMGYSVPSYQYLFKKSGSQYVLRMHLLDHIFDDMHIEELETIIVLPLGVSNVQVNTPYGVNRLPDSVAYKYLDTIGRMVIKLHKTNLVEQHIQDVEIVYDWQSLMLFHEPILISTVFYLMFIVVIVYVRLDCSIHHQENHVKRD